MARTRPWKDIVNDALISGRDSSLDYIYKRVEREVGKLSSNQKAAVRRTLQEIGSHGKQKGVWRKSKAAFKSRPKKPRKPRKGKPEEPSKPSKREIEVKEQASDAIRKALDHMAEGARAYADSDVSLSENADGSIDGETRISGISHRISIDAFLLHLEQYATPVIVGSHLHQLAEGGTDVWVSIVLIRPVRRPDVEKTGLINEAGEVISHVPTHWRKATEEKIAFVFLLARDINANFSAKRRLRVQTILYRLHWNAQGVQP